MSRRLISKLESKGKKKFLNKNKESFAKLKLSSIFAIA